MFILGITGGIGSGKTAVSDRFQALGIEVVDADLISRMVVEPGQPALKEIESHFGPEVINEDGSLNRAHMRSLVFDNEAERLWLEQLLHPIMAKEMFSALESAKSEYAILVSPLLIESKQNEICDRVLLVDVPESIQVERTMTRDNNSAEQVKSIIAAQTSRKDRIAKADDIIENTQGLEQP